MPLSAVLSPVVAPVVALVLASAAVTVPAGAPPGAALADADAGAASRVVAYLDRLVASGVPGVAVVVTRGDDVVVAAARGADGEAPVTTQTRFRAASLSKSFTATAVLQLVERGLVSLDEPVVTYLPELVTADPRSDLITVRQLLNQSSGLTDGTLGFDQYAAGPRTAQEAVALLRRSRLAYDPGTSWDYCNPNYWVAGRLVEVVSGERLTDYLRRHVLAPLGMDRTDHADVPADAVGVSPTHAYAFGLPVHLGDPPGFAGGGAGVVTTADDLGRWLRFQAGRPVPGQVEPVLGAHLLAEQHRRQSPLTGYPVGYALGWWDGVPADGGTPRVSHTGTGAGHSAYQGLFPDGTAIGVLVGASSPTGDRVAHDLRAVLAGRAPREAAGAPVLWLDVAATGVALGAVALSVRGAGRAPDWAARRGRRVRWLVLAVLVAVPAVAGMLPWAAGRAVGRQAGWVLLWHTAPVPAAALALVALAATLVAAARVAAVVRAGAADGPDPAGASAGDPAAARAVGGSRP